MRLLGIRGKNLLGDRFIAILGLSAPDQEVLERTFRDLLSEQDTKELPPLKSLHDNKGPRFLGIKMIPSLLQDDTPQVLMLVEDVSEVEHLRQRLHLYEHLAIMGKLSLCVAHELNPSTTIFDCWMK